jgi:hypothetical protein
MDLENLSISVVVSLSENVSCRHIAFHYILSIFIPNPSPPSCSANVPTALGLEPISRRTIIANHNRAVTSGLLFHISKALAIVFRNQVSNYFISFLFSIKRYF